MGSEYNDADSDEQPEHRVWLDAFWIYQTEVTNAMYRQCVEEDACQLPGDTTKYQDADYADHPVVRLSWYDADAYCQWSGGQLPTEAQWEKAARGTDGRKYPWGNESLTCSLANYSGCIDGTAPVGSYDAGVSPYGALDMAGNVWEWVADWYDISYYSRSPYENPAGPTDGNFRVIRGGSWFADDRYLRVSFRLRYYPDFSVNYFGFRCLLSP
jgi:eukaryotic-like serine/threonine-protein kinase